MATGADSLADPRYLATVIDVAVRGLPHAFRDVVAEPGQAVVLEIGGASGDPWTLTREEQRWTLWRGGQESATTRIRMNDDTAWKLLFNALPASEAARAIHVEGRVELGQALLRARSVIV